MILNGKGASPGAAIGRIFIFSEKKIIPEERCVPSGEEQFQLDRYIYVKNEAIQELGRLKSSMEKTDPAKALIFDAHKEIVEDIIINDEIPSKILNERWTGDRAIYFVYETVMSIIRKTDDPHIAESALDFDDVRSLLLRIWFSGGNETLSVPDEPCIIAAKEFKPSDTAGIDKTKVIAILTETGGITSHAAIIAKSFGIPAVFGIKGLLNSVRQGQTAAVNADEGTVILDPPENVINFYRKKCDSLRFDREHAENFKYADGRTSCGVKIDIGLNIGNVNDWELAEAACADSVGVFRTEFIYMMRDSLPSEDEQFDIYRKVLECFGERPVILRTLDIGGDKRIKSIDLPAEENPFLGNRALRFCFSNPGIFRTQIRACLRASVYGNLWIMFPMVASLDDIRKAKEFVSSACNELKKEGIPFNTFKTGIMIEIPSIALIADLAAKEVDFASIGSNDLCQYLCAADRMNSNVEGYYQSFHPALLILLKKIISDFNYAGKPISFCGELGGDPLAVPLLIGLGMRKLSMGYASVAAVKRAAASVSVKKAEEIAARALEMGTAGEIEEYLRFNQIRI